MRTSAPRSRLRLAACALAIALGLASFPAQAQNPAPASQRELLSVMTFNIRYGTANDGVNHWTNRRQFLFDVVREAAPDVAGLQEALDAQIREIVAAIPGYGVVGVGRDDGKTKGEYAAILYRTSRFHVSDSGTFWFSDTPSVVASKSWGNTITRICTWARFVDRDGSAFWHFNVHLDHQSQPSREKSTELLARRIAERRNIDEPAIVTGDFNVGEANPAIATLVGPGAGGRAPLLLDTYRVRFPQERVVGTFTGFVLNETGGDKIDYILVPPGTDVLDAAINRIARDGRYPSDHFPVTARIRLK